MGGRATDGECAGKVELKYCFEAARKEGTTHYLGFGERKR
jgi:hypothetical protein